LIVADVQGGGISIVGAPNPHGPRKRWGVVFWRDGKPIRVEIPAGGVRCGHPDFAIGQVFPSHPNRRPFPLSRPAALLKLADHMALCEPAWACAKRRRLLEDAGIELPARPASTPELCQECRDRPVEVMVLVGVYGVRAA